MVDEVPDWVVHLRKGQRKKRSSKSLAGAEPLEIAVTLYPLRSRTTPISIYMYSTTCPQNLESKGGKITRRLSYLGTPLNHHEALSDAEACARIVMAANGYSPNDSSKTIIECSSCNGRLRGTTGRTGTIICPQCKHEFTAST